MSKKVYSMGMVCYFSTVAAISTAIIDVSLFKAIFISDIADDISAHHPDLVVVDASDGNDERRILVVTQKDVAIDSKAGPLYNPCLLVHTSSSATVPQLTFQVFFNSICDEPFTVESLDKHLKTMETNYGFAICPRIPSLPCEV